MVRGTFRLKRVAYRAQFLREGSPELSTLMATLTHQVRNNGS